MKTPHLVLIRHSLSSINPAVAAHAWQLSTPGRQRLPHIANQLGPLQLDVLYSSPEPKALQTAQGIGDHLGLTPVAEAAFVEQQRHTVPWFDDPTDFETAIATLFARPFDVVFGEETAADALARFEDGVRLVRTQHPGQTIGIVCHGTVMALFMAAHSATPAMQWWRGWHMPDFIALELPLLTPTARYVPLQTDGT